MFKILLILPLFLGAQQAQIDSINTLLNNWHHAAAVADEETFFDKTMAPDAVYIGTDATELWGREEMKIWAQPFFDRDTAWSFTVMSRNVYLSENENVAWFDELLDTWMGTCRGSGVLEKINKQWKLKHYQLAIAVPNEVVKDYLQLIGKKPN